MVHTDTKNSRAFLMQFSLSFQHDFGAESPDTGGERGEKRRKIEKSTKKRGRKEGRFSHFAFP
jgi:hypothetical protein